MAAHTVTVRRIAELGIDIVEAQSRRRFARHIHDEFGIGLIVTGAQRSASGRGDVEATAGDLISVNPGEVHDGMPIGDAARRWHMLYFAPQLITDTLADMAEGNSTHPHEFAHPALRSPQAAPLFAKLYQAVTQTHPGGTHLAVEEMLPLLLAHLLDRPVPAPVVGQTTAIRAKTMIDDAPSAPVSLADLAREANMSRFQLVRAFSRLTGLTPHAYLVQRRIQQVRQFIAQGMPLADAALACGFADQSHMTRCFVRCFGFSPGQYAREARSG